MKRIASARKSLGEYKPLMIEDMGNGRKRTTVLGQRGYMERIQPQTKFYDGPTEVWHSKRGVTFATREEAIAYSQRYIERLEAKIAERKAAYESRHTGTYSE